MYFYYLNALESEFQLFLYKLDIVRYIKIMDKKWIKIQSHQRPLYSHIEAFLFFLKVPWVVD